MPSFLYVRNIDNFHRSMESQAPRSVPSLTRIRRDYFVVQTDTGVAIQVPLRHLADTALIAVEGDGDCTLQGRNAYRVMIHNGVDVSQIQRTQMDRTVRKTASVLQGNLAKNAAEEYMEQSGLGKRVAGRARNKVHSTVHSALSEAGKRSGTSFRTTQAISNGISSATGKAARWGSTKALGGAVSLATRGTGAVGLMLESTSTGAGASPYDRSFTGRAEDGNKVHFLIKGSPD